MSDNASSKKLWTTLIAAIGGFAIFLIILFIAYLPQKAGPIAEGTLSPEERAARLADLRAKEKAALTTYAWIDQQGGVVRLPIDRAIELTIQELNAKK
jgi:hypothetical protein